jgi:Tfp pilus assembly protein PilV
MADGRLINLPSAICHLQSCQKHRAGLSLLEVLLSLTIFLLSFIAIGRLITLSSDMALDIQQRSQAVQLCQSKLAEVAIGAVPLQAQSNVPFEEDLDWQWSLDCQLGDVENLWNVTVTVSRQGTDGAEGAISLTQMVLDPTLRGSIFDSTATQASTDSSEQARVGNSP